MRRAMLQASVLRAAALGLVLVALTGCETEPYCLTCDDGGGGDAGMDGSIDAAGGDANFDANIPDAGPDGCIDSELCNDIDDDCDGFVDEGFDLNTNPVHCGECDRRCNPPHAFPACEDGMCTMGDCDIGFYDLNMDDSDGCEYRCSGMETEDSICNLRDDDCDGVTDEDVDLNGDPVNCGRCGRVCNAPHSTASCDMGVCALGGCDTGFHDIDGRADNGCEYACTAMSPPDEVCNSRDDDCDGMVDEGDPGGGVSCGSTVGVCGTFDPTMPPTTACMSGRVVCVGEIVPTTETCNGMDDDCDSMTDEGDPGGGASCGTSEGLCVSGTLICTGGAVTCVGGVSPGIEVCDGFDNDCDRMIDEADPMLGTACGTTTGACTAGSRICSGGVLVCSGGTGPTVETCNGIDDNCDGSTDEGNPGGGASCGGVGECTPGTAMCTGGAVVCVGAGAPGTETCNGRDDDCDGTIDEGNPGGGAACGSAVGACGCSGGTCGTGTGTLNCRSGSVVCEGATLPIPEICDGPTTPAALADNDCDGVVDNGFSLATDVNNCGSCGNVCFLPNAVESCVAGVCTIAACLPGFVDLDPGMPGCEYPCSFSGGEVCNGIDDNCDGMIDEGVSPPPSFCNPNGVCMGTTATCGGAAGWTCIYPSTFETPEVSCDSLDNDCDGFTDEDFPLLGTGCSNGVGACRRNGSYVCNTTSDGVSCNAAAAGAPADEECNAIDDDCDGSVDERVVDDPGTAWRDGVDLDAIDTVTVDLGGGVTMEMMAYEASRPDATDVLPGSVENIACSRPDTYPWVSVTWDEAQAACCALNTSGTCPAPGGSGWRLCDAPDWEEACDGPVDVCTHSYASMCSTSQRLTCNGAEHDCDSSTPGNQDCLYNTGDAAFPMCFTDWGAAGDIYDLSGNVREWTATSRDPACTTAADCPTGISCTGGFCDIGLFEVRGGSYNHVEPGRSCQWDFTVGQRSGAAPNTGFRCCMY